MASTGRISNVASTLCRENQSLVGDFRRTIGMMKEIGVELEKQNQGQMVKELEDTVMQLLNGFEDCSCFSNVMESIARNYQPKHELTNFKRLFQDELSKTKASKTFDKQKQQLVRDFKEAIWNVHHAGELMAGDEEEDIVAMGSTSGTFFRNTTCPITTKSLLELADPVRSQDCQHIYEKQAIQHYTSKAGRCRCPCAGCPKIVSMDKVTADPLLLAEIEELRRKSMSKEQDTTCVDEDFTREDEDENNW